LREDFSNKRREAVYKDTIKGQRDCFARGMSSRGSREKSTTMVRGKAHSTSGGGSSSAESTTTGGNNSSGKYKKMSYKFKQQLDEAERLRLADGEEMSILEERNRELEEMVRRMEQKQQDEVSGKVNGEALKDERKYKFVYDTARDKLFPYVKFISHGSQLKWDESQTSIGWNMTEICGIRPDCRKAWWLTWRSVVPRAIADTRNNRTTAIKRALLSKYIGVRY